MSYKKRSAFKVPIEDHVKYLGSKEVRERFEKEIEEEKKREAKGMARAQTYFINT